MASGSDNHAKRLDDPARAGWLCYVAGRRQDEFARSLGVSRRTAQRLVALAVREKLVRIWLDHPIMRCMDLAEAIRQRFGLERCEVVPSVPGSPAALTGLAQVGTATIERELSPPGPRIIAVGTGRALRTCVDELTPTCRPDHTVVALLGHTMPGGRATPNNIAVRMAAGVEG